MAGSLNKVFLIGNLCADPETRMAGSTPVTNFRVACNESWKDKDGNKQERVEYVTIVAWRAQSDIAQKYLRKGSKVHIEGRLQTRSWEKDGEKRYATEVVCDHFIMLDGRPGTAAEANQASGGVPTGGNDDDLPF